LTIKVARSSQSEQQGVENVLAAVAAAVEKVPRKWDGVQVGTELLAACGIVCCSGVWDALLVKVSGLTCRLHVSLWRYMCTCPSRSSLLVPLAEQLGSSSNPPLLSVIRLPPPHPQALFLKTSDSVALPIYQVLPEAPARISKD
jgi:hypothetical protein